MRVSEFIVTLSLAIPAVALGGTDVAPGKFTYTTFDVPPIANQSSLSVDQANSAGEIVGFQTNTGGNTQGFLRLVNGTFETISEPKNNTSLYPYTNAYSINTKGEIAGTYYNTTTDLYTGFTYLNGRYTSYSVAGLPSGSDTYVYGINDEGETCGFYQTPPDYATIPFINEKGTIVTFTIPNATEATCYAVNDKLEAAGYYYDGTTYHGFIRSASGTITVVDAPNVGTGTFLEGLNNSGWTSGHFVDTSNYEHGFLRSPAGKFTLIDVPGAAVVSGGGTAGGALTDECTVVGHFDPSGGPPQQGYIATPSQPCGSK